MKKSIFTVISLLFTCAISAQSDFKTLQEAYKDYFSIGVAVSMSNLMSPDRATLIKEQFNSMTAENDMKPISTQPNEGQWNFSNSDNIMRFASMNNIKLRGHCLIWHGQTGNFMFHDKEGKLVSKEVLFERMKTHIETVVRRYKGRIYAWDVVNEAISDDANAAHPYRESLYYQIAGDEFIRKAFEYAHAADPDALLFYNDYNDTNPMKRERIYNMVKEMKAAGIPIHGIGMQGHYNVASPTESELRAAINRYREVVDVIHVTELDVRVNTRSQGGQLQTSAEESGVSSFTQEADLAQCRQYEMLFRVFRENSDVVRNVTFWNTDDATTWLDGRRGNSGRSYPLLFDDNLKPKSAYYEVVFFDKSNALPMTGAGLPEVGKAPRYCNPLPMIIGQGGNASGDVTVIKDNGKYYMFCTGGGAWVSEDMLNWSFHSVANVPVAPDVVKYNGSFYMCGNESPLYKADNPLGPYTSLGAWKNTPGIAGGWNEPFDMHIFVDDDNTPYLFWSGRGVSGIYAVKLDPNDLTKFAGTVKHLITFNNKHEWERYGEKNEYPDVAWIEGPQMLKHNNTYYLVYSASGTQWRTYASGYYTSKSPMGPFTYAPNNPLLRNTEGPVSGTAHGSMIEGPDGNIWKFYTIVLSNPPGGRRIGMDRIVFDKQGNMSVKITDSPQWAPGVVSDPTKGNSGSVPITINKMRAMNALSKVSSEQPGRDAAYAIDNSTGTWWEPAPDDLSPTLTIDLSPATRFDIVQLFTVDGVRLMFSGGRRGGRPAAGAPPTPPSYVYQYKIEVSMNGETWNTALDQSNNSISKNTVYEEIPPVKCRFARLVITNWPKEFPLGVIEFTLFGKAAADVLPATQPIPPVKL